MLKRILILFSFTLVIGQILNAQVTTSSFSGTVKDTSGQALGGATVTAVHTPSGTTYSTIVNNEGVFNLPNVRIGGPYRITVNYVGLQPFALDGINLQLGVPYNVNAVLGENVQSLENVVVTGRSTRAGSDRTGTSTNINSRQIASLPTITRSITDFTRLTPQANGNSFAGRDARYNNVMVDGANLNNNFGLSSDPLPGGGNNPISLDAIEEISVNIAPFDVRQGSFTGAGITAVTKSGTNTFKGTAYTYYRDQSFNGLNVGDVKLAEGQAQKNTIYGGSIGGPIIKNKVFFFINGEFEQRTFPGIQFSPTGGSGIGVVSSTPVDSLRKFSDFLRSQYGYETGPFDNFPNFASKNHKIIGKIDWNISNAHKLTLKYSELVSNNDVALNSSSVPNGGGFSVTGASGTLSRAPVNRFSNRSMSFANSNYGFQDVVRTGTIELNSTSRGKFANQFLATISKIKATRTSPSEVFPFIDIYNGSGQNYMSAGYEPYSYNNDVINDVYNVTNNFTYFAGKHTLTAGASYEFQRVGNMFMAASQSYYVFNSLNDFITNQAPRYYALTYSVVPGKDAVYSAELNIGQLGFYVQDDINVNERFKVIAGIRVDRPIYSDEPLENPSVSALSLPNEDGVLTNYSTGMWPKSSFYFSPRVGFRWDAEGNKNMIVRGGTGVFTGRIPFVWLTNIPTNSGMYQFGASVTQASRLGNFRFNPNPMAYRDSFPSTAGGGVPSNVVLTDPNFKFPQVWRSNIAIDKRLGDSWTFTAEALYTKDINAIKMRNANEKDPNGKFTAGPDNRERFLATGDRRYYSNINSAVVLENTNKGQSFQLTGQISKAFTDGFFGSLAYTYSFAQEVTANPGSQASSVWNGNATRGTQNDEELSYSNYTIPHRIVGSISYRKEYLKFFATTVSLFYEGAHQGNFSYYYNGDLNNDGNNTTDLLYIPRNPSEIIFVNQTASGSNNAYTAQQQSDAFFQFIENSPYLRNHKGQYAERNAALLPFYHRLDFKLLQDFFIMAGGRRHTLQLSADVLNFANMLNKDWGIRNQTVVVNPLVPAGVNTAGQPTFRMTQVGGQLPTDPFQETIGTSSTWGLQVGLRYIF